MKKSTPALTPGPSFTVDWTGLRLAARRTEYESGSIIFAQGEPASHVFHLEQGTVRLSTVSHSGKEAVIAQLDAGLLFGEDCVAGRSHRLTTALAVTRCTVTAAEKEEVARRLRDEPVFAKEFLAYVMHRNLQIEQDLVNHLFNSSEKRLARTLLMLAHYGTPDEVHGALPPMSQETLAQMVGTTRSRVNFFMNKFRRLGLIEYNGGLTVKKSLLAVVLHD